MPLPLMAIAAGAGLLGKLMGKGAEGAAKERGDQNDFQQRQNQLDNQQFSTQQSAAADLSGLQEKATMDRAQMGVTAPNARMKQALLGSLLQSYQNRQIEAPSGIRVGKISGGLDLGAMSQAVRDGAGGFSADALAALKNKSDIPGATDYMKSGMVAPPVMDGYQGAGKMESVLSGGGLLGGLLGAIAEIKNLSGSGSKFTPEDMSSYRYGG